MPDGWIKIYKSIRKWEWYDDSATVHIFLHLLLNAKDEDSRWHEIDLKQGQLIISIRQLGKELNISVQGVRTRLNRLQKSGCIEITPYKLYTVITILNYDLYQGEKEEESKPEPIEEVLELVEQPVKSEPPKVSAKEATDKRMKEFYKSLIPYVEVYGRSMVRDFYDYWSETNKSQSKMRWEQQPTWDLKRRLATWAKRDNNYGNNRSNNEKSEQRASEATQLIASLIQKNRTGKNIR